MGERQRDDGMRTVAIALAVNLVVAVMKAVAGVVLASAGLLAEAAHSVADCTTELFLVTAVHRSGRPADRRHPFGYGKERYFWSLLAALSVFAVGAGYSAYQGITTLTGHSGDSASPYLGYVVIGLSALVEGYSLRQAAGRARREADRTGQPTRTYIRDPDDPTVKSVLLEDSAALLGLLFALAGLAVRQITGLPWGDGIAALAIAALLIAAAYELARTNMGLLIGQQARPGLVGDIEALLAVQAEILQVVEVRTMMIGTGRILVCARVDFHDRLSTGDAEHACVRLHGVLGHEFPDIEDVFIEPVPRADQGVRDAAAQRSI